MLLIGKRFEERSCGKRDSVLGVFIALLLIKLECVSFYLPYHVVHVREFGEGNWI